MSSRYLTYCGLRGEGLVWLIGTVVCLLAAPWVQFIVSMDMDVYVPINLHFRDYKVQLVASLTHEAVIGL